MALPASEHVGALEANGTPGTLRLTEISDDPLPTNSALRRRPNIAEANWNQFFCLRLNLDRHIRRLDHGGGHDPGCESHVLDRFAADEGHNSKRSGL
jgi:hypothetical protein